MNFFRLRKRKINKREQAILPTYQQHLIIVGKRVGQDSKGEKEETEEIIGMGGIGRRLVHSDI